MEICNTKFKCKEEIQKLLNIFVNSTPKYLIETKQDIDKISLLLKAIK